GEENSGSGNESPANNSRYSALPHGQAADIGTYGKGGAGYTLGNRIAGQNLFRSEIVFDPHKLRKQIRDKHLASPEDQTSVAVKILKKPDRQQSGIMPQQGCGHQHPRPKNKVRPTDVQLGFFMVDRLFTVIQ